MRLMSFEHYQNYPKYFVVGFVLVALLGSVSPVRGQTQPNTVQPNTIPTNQMAPNTEPTSRSPTNTEAPNLSAPNTSRPNTVPPSNGFTGRPNPDGSLPVRPGALVNPRGERTQDVQVAQANGQQIVPDRIRNTGTPGGNPQPRPTQPIPVPVPGQPQQAVPNIGQPFPQLTVEEAAELDKFLAQWEKRTSSIKVFESQFQCWVYGSNLLENSDANTPDYCTYGIVRFAAPNRGSYEILGERDANGKAVPGKRQSKILTTGEAVLDYNFDEKVVSVSMIPKDQQHELVGGGPLAFVFGTSPEALKRRFFLRLSTPASRAQMGEVWLEAYPRLAEDAAEFQRVQLVVDRTKIIPKALIQHANNEKEKRTFQFLEKTMIISAKDDVYKDFIAKHLQPRIEKGWTRDIQNVPQVESPQVASPNTRPLNAQTANPNPAYANQPQQNPPPQNRQQDNSVRPITPQPVPAFNPPQPQPSNVVETPLYNSQGNGARRY